VGSGRAALPEGAGGLLAEFVVLLAELADFRVEELEPPARRSVGRHAGVRGTTGLLNPDWWWPPSRWMRLHLGTQVRLGVEPGAADAGLPGDGADGHRAAGGGHAP
jgi:hypothetical protein